MSPEERADLFAAIADQYRDVVRDRGGRDAHRWLAAAMLDAARAQGRAAVTVADWMALASVQAAATPAGVLWADLTAWTRGRELRPHGTHAAVKRHAYYGEKPCDACRAYATRTRTERLRRARAEGREKRHSQRTKAKALDEVPAPDPWLVDEVAVRRACAGERVELTKAERAEAVRVLAQQGLSQTQVARRLLMHRATVKRYWPQDEGEARAA